MLPVSYFIYFALTVFTIAVYGALSRKNMLLIFFCVETMIVSGSMIFVVLAATAESQIFVLFAWMISAAETMVALAIFLYIMRKAGKLNVNKIKELKW